MRRLVGAGLAMGLVLFGTLVAVAEGAQQEVTVHAQVIQRLVFSIVEGNRISLVADPLDNPVATAGSRFEVKTNALSYSIIGSFGVFEVGDTGYDLIENGNFKIMSTAPGTGMPIDDWTVPEGEMEILSGEDGLTNGEAIWVGYMLAVDFAVPAGAGHTTIVFTATVTM